MPLMILLLLWPLAEIVGFVWIGGTIGVGPTLAFVLLSGLLGVALLRRAGLATLRHFRADLEAGRTPVPAALGGLWRLVAGLLLIIPGFLSSGVALLLSIPVVRRLLTKALTGLVQTGHVSVQSAGFEMPLRREPGPTVIEGQFHELPDRRV
jgi:UPF0716 protein FxsA